MAEGKLAEGGVGGSSIVRCQSARWHVVIGTRESVLVDGGRWLSVHSAVYVGPRLSQNVKLRAVPNEGSNAGRSD